MCQESCDDGCRIEEIRARNLSREVYYAGDPIFVEGARATCAYIVEYGKVAVSKAAGGREETLGTLGPGSILGEMALIDDHPRMATARAVDQTTLLCVERRRFQDKIESADPVVRKLLRILVNNVRSITDRHIAVLEDAERAAKAV